MSRSFKMKPCRKKTPAHRFDPETKTTVKNKMWKLVNSDTPDQDENMIMFTKYSFLSILVILLSTSCVSKRMLIQEQDKSKLCAVNLDDCEQRYTVLLAQNKDFSNEIIQLENQLANERNRVALLEQQLEYFKSTNTNLLDRLSDLAVVSKTGADNIRKSLDAINDQNMYQKQ